MNEQHQRFLQMTNNIMVDHAVIVGLLDDIAQASYENARKQVVILKQLLINHFFVEEFLLYPYIKERYITKKRVNRASLFDVYDINDGCEDMVKLLGEIDGYIHIGRKVVKMLSGCVDSDWESFRICFANLSNLLKERIQFENAILEKQIAQRVRLHVSVIFAISQRETVVGTTVDISASGCLVRCAHRPGLLAVGVEGQLSFTNRELELPCAVARLTTDGFAVRFNADCPVERLAAIQYAPYP